MKNRFLLTATMISLLAAPSLALADASEPVIDYGNGSYSAQPETGNRSYSSHRHQHYRGSVGADVAAGVGLAIVGTIVNEAINDGYRHRHYGHRHYGYRHRHGGYYNYPGVYGQWWYGSTDLGNREYPF